MSFKADHVSIAEFGTSIGALGADSTSARSYVAEWLDVGHAESRMFATVAAKAAKVRDALNRTYGQLDEIVTVSSGELAKTAQYYCDTDHAEARRLDAKY